MKKHILLLLLLGGFYSFGQVPIELYKQFNGRYNHTAIGNTLNILDNSLAGNFCEILSESSAELLLEPNQQVVGAYLYWSGPINSDVIIEEQIDNIVSLNGTEIIADDIYTYTLTSNHNYFACFTDVTQIIQGIGNGNYTLTNLDLSFILTSPYFCTSMGWPANQTNYGGWALSIVYEQDNLPYNQVSVFNGFDGVSSLNNYIAIQLTNLNVIDNDGAKIAFLAWEGDENLANGESLFINGNQLSNLPLNPANNAFNGTNSYTNSDELHNMDLDFYSIQNNIAVGDTEALIELRSLQDLVMVNYVVTVLNSQLPDATVVIDDLDVSCDDRDVWVAYTVFNTNSTEYLPESTPLAFYANGVFVGSSATINDIEIGGEEPNSIVLTIPVNIANNFTLTIAVDDVGTGVGEVQETNETNNTTIQQVNLLLNSPIENLTDLEICDEGNNQATFDLTQVEINVPVGATQILYFMSLSEAESLINPIEFPEVYVNTNSIETIFIRVNYPSCYRISNFIIEAINCLTDNISGNNGISPNGDGVNETLVILGITDVFEQHTIKIFNRYGTLIFEGGYKLPWNGKANRGINHTNSLLPVSTYYYVIYLHDNFISEPITGWVYLNY